MPQTKVARVKPILILNGPGLARLGEIDRDLYGTDSLDDVRRLCEAACAENGYPADFRQSDDTGELLEWIVETRGDSAGIIINPAIATLDSADVKNAYLAIMHALPRVRLPVIEVHLTNLFAQRLEPKVSYDSTASIGFICGFGIHGYVMAIKGMVEHLSAVPGSRIEPIITD